MKSDFQCELEERMYRTVRKAVEKWTMVQCRHFVCSHDLENGIDGLGDNELREYVIECIFEIWFHKIENNLG
jgi:hypothetical protein